MEGMVKRNEYKGKNERKVKEWTGRMWGTNKLRGKKGKGKRENER